MNRFKKSLLYIVLILCAFFITVPDCSAENSINNIWTGLLRKHVSKKGMVDYGSWYTSDTDMTLLKNYLAELSQINTGIIMADTTLTRDTRKKTVIAYYLNLYNASIIQMVLNHYPITSIKKIGGIRGPWKMEFIPVPNNTISLDDIEHGILRKEFSEPRIHFALVCASTSCPPLRREAYQPENLNEQLNDQERIFITDITKNRWVIGKHGFLSKEKIVEFHLSSIFNWFGKDFDGEKGVLKRIRPYLLSSDIKSSRYRMLLDNGRFKVTYLKYDWSLNGK